MNTEALGNDVNVDEILRRIRENIKKRRDNGGSAEVTPVEQPPAAEADVIDEGLQENLDYIYSNWDVHAQYSISSHRPLLGRLLVFGRRLIHGEVRRYVDLIATKQSQFNAHAVHALNSYIRNLDSKIDSVNDDIDSKVSAAMASVKKDTTSKINSALASVNNDIDTKLNATVSSVNNDIDTKLNAAINRDVDLKVNRAVAAVNEDIRNKAWLANLLDNRIKRKITKPKTEGKTDNEMNYFVFEEKFRGSSEDIKNRQSIFLEYFKNCQNVLDIGCGRGEFLSILKENGTGAKGIDINEDMVLYCQKNGLDVQKAEVLSYLGSLENKSLDGVFSGQVVEHLQPNELINLVKLCHDKMKYGTYFIAETINPLCLSVFSASFYMDLSHVKPVHPETIRFLLESVGFRDIRLKFFSPFPESVKLSKLEIPDNTSGVEKVRLEAMNQNINKLNSLLYGYQDYAVIAKK